VTVSGQHTESGLRAGWVGVNCANIIRSYLYSSHKSEAGSGRELGNFIWPTVYMAAVTTARRRSPKKACGATTITLNYTHRVLRSKLRAWSYERKKKKQKLRDCPGISDNGTPTPSWVARKTAGRLSIIGMSQHERSRSGVREGHVEKRSFCQVSIILPRRERVEYFFFSLRCWKSPSFSRNK
jgi:hypothetical protein